MAVKITWNLSTLMSCINLSVRIVTKSPKIGPLYVYSPSLWTQEKGPAELSQIHGLSDLPIPKFNLLEANSHSAEDKEDAGGGLKNGSILNLQNFTPMNTLPRQQGHHNILRSTICD